MYFVLAISENSGKIPVMKETEIMSTLAARRPGAMLSVVVNRPAKVRKAFEGEGIRKRSRFSLQLASYGARKPVKEAVENRERSEPQTPGWVAKKYSLDNGLTFWEHGNGTRYLALPRFGAKAESEWLKNGEPVPVESISGMLLASEIAKRPDKREIEAEGQALFNAIKLENIESVS